jgi:hypothetical protein
MQTIRCTQKLLKFLEARARDLIAGDSDHGPIGAWFAHLIWVERRKCILFTHADTLFSFVILEVVKNDVLHFGSFFTEGLYKCLSLHQFPSSQVSELVESSQPIVLSATNNRSVLGSMVDLSFQIDNFVWKQGGLQHCDMAQLNLHLNQIPMGAIGYDSAKDRFMTALRQIPTPLGLDVGHEHRSTHEQPMSTTAAIVSLKSVVQEMDVFSDEYHAYLNKRTGELVTISDEDIGIVERDEKLGSYPKWQQNVIRKTKEVLGSKDYLSLPSRFEIHEYNLMERFCYSVGDEKLRNKLLYQIRGAGAFRRFKDAIHEYGIADDWYRFRQAALEEIAVEWLEAEKIPYTRDDE